MPVTVRGLEEFDRALTNIGGLARPTIIAAMRRASRPMVVRAKELCPVGEGHVKRRRGKGKTVSASAGADGASSGLRGDKLVHLRDTIKFTEGDESGTTETHGYVGTKAHTAHLVEYGHVMVHGRVKRGKAKRSRNAAGKFRWAKGDVIEDTRRASVSVVPPHPFMRPAGDATAAECMGNFVGEMNETLDRVASGGKP